MVSRSRSDRCLRHILMVSEFQSCCDAVPVSCSCCNGALSSTPRFQCRQLYGVHCCHSYSHPPRHLENPSRFRGICWLCPHAHCSFYLRCHASSLHSCLSLASRQLVSLRLHGHIQLSTFPLLHRQLLDGRSPYHDYAHLLEVNLRGGIFGVHQLLLEHADIMPFKRRLGTPLRHITWMRMRTNHFDVTARRVVTALKSPSPLRNLLHAFKQPTEEAAKAVLFEQFQIFPCADGVRIPSALSNWVNQLVQQHLHPLPLLELAILLTLFLPQIPREGLKSKDLLSLQLPQHAQQLERLFDGLGGMDHYLLKLDGWPPPMVFVPSHPHKTWAEWLDNFQEIQFGLTIGDLIRLGIEPYVEAPFTSPNPPFLFLAAIITATQSRPTKLKAHATDERKSLARANYKAIEFAVIPSPKGLVHLPPRSLLPAHTDAPEWADTKLLKHIEQCRLRYASFKGTTWNCSHLVQLAETHQHHKPLTLGIPVNNPNAPAPLPHQEELLLSLRQLTDILLLDRPNLNPPLMRLAQHIIDTARKDSGHFVAVLSSVYLSLLTGRKALSPKHPRSLWCWQNLQRDAFDGLAHLQHQCQNPLPLQRKPSRESD